MFIRKKEETWLTAVSFLLPENIQEVVLFNYAIHKYSLRYVLHTYLKEYFVLQMVSILIYSLKVVTKVQVQCHEKLYTY